MPNNSGFYNDSQSNKLIDGLGILNGHNLASSKFSQSKSGNILDKNISNFEGT
jgi:hypothetical protein